MDVVKNRAELVNEAAFNMGVLSTGQVLDSADAARIDLSIDPMLLQLSQDRIIDILDTAAIPSEFFFSLSVLLANAAGPGFGIPFSKDVKDMHEAYLKRSASTGASYDTLPLPYF